MKTKELGFNLTLQKKIKKQLMSEFSVNYNSLDKKLVLRKFYNIVTTF